MEIMINKLVFLLIDICLFFLAHLLIKFRQIYIKWVKEMSTVIYEENKQKINFKMEREDENKLDWYMVTSFAEGS